MYKNQSREWYCYSCKTGVTHDLKELPNAEAAGNSELAWVCTYCSRCLNKDGGDEYCQKLLNDSQNDDN